MPRVLAHRWWIFLTLIGVLLLRGVAEGQPATTSTMAIGSKNFTENRLLAEMMAQLIEAHSDIRVERKVNLGGTTVVFTALQNGDIDAYPEYTGTGWSIHLKIAEPVRDPLRAYLVVADEFEKRFDVTWLRPFGFSNSYALAMDEGRAKELGIRTISDLKSHEQELRAGVSHEFLNRQDGYPGLAKAYGLHISHMSGMEHGLAYEAIRSHRIDLVDTWTTDGKLLRYPIRILQDDRHFFPPYDCAPIVRSDTLERHPELRELLNRLAFRIDDQKMRKLNYRVEEEGGSFAEVARGFLQQEGLLKGAKPRPVAHSERSHGFLAFMWSRRSQTLKLAGQHMWLTAIAVLLAVLVAVPIGISLTRRQVLATPVMAAAG